MSGAVLEVEGLTVRHGQLEAVRDVTLQVRAGEAFAIIGANGAGKSTFLRTVSGLHRPVRGTIVLDGVDVTHLAAGKRVASGISMVPEGRRLFPSLSVEENLLVGQYRS
ncbi:MAG: ATP-binding cassette domain-containing protein, partial [Acidimicrobiales bacterium]